MYSIEFKNVVKKFGKTEVIKGLNLSVKKGRGSYSWGPLAAANLLFFG